LRDLIDHRTGGQADASTGVVEALEDDITSWLVPPGGLSALETVREDGVDAGACGPRRKDGCEQQGCGSNVE
jgi:hypothetical protein